ncbi:hypothetical protein L208DRAFT_1506162, partial [Tricholoma matsutake]
AWGKLDELKAILPSSVPWQALSATFPPHILKTVETKILQPNYASIQVSANRPNVKTIAFTSLETPQNYDCFLMTPFDLASQPCVLIFFDDTDLASRIAEHLDKLLPMQYCDQGVVQHYHSGMSETYLQCAHLAFTEQDGICKVLCATFGESPMQGVDFLDVKIVCNAGLPGNIVDSLQCRGCIGRRDGDQGLFVIFHEPWVMSIHLEQYEGSCDDPDQPQGTLKPHLQLMIVPVVLQSSLCSVKTVANCFLQTILVTRPHQHCTMKQCFVVIVIMMVLSLPTFSLVLSS